MCGGPCLYSQHSGGQEGQIDLFKFEVNLVYTVSSKLHREALSQPKGGERRGKEGERRRGRGRGRKGGKEETPPAHACNTISVEDSVTSSHMCIHTHNHIQVEPNLTCYGPDLSPSIK